MNHNSSGNNAFTDGTNATQTNPFTGDLKGEFTSDFGTSTNAVSHMFKGDGMGGGGDNKRLIAFAVGGLLVLGIGAFLLLSEDEQGFNTDDDFAGQQEQLDAGEADNQSMADFDQPPADASKTSKPADVVDAAKKPDPGVPDPAIKTDPALSDNKAPSDNTAKSSNPGSELTPGQGSVSSKEPANNNLAESASLANPKANSKAEMASTGSITVSQPFDGASLAYDETQGPATFSWSGPADLIVFARSASMEPVVRQRSVAGRQSYRFLHPHPGRWYWRLQNAEGGTAVQSFVIAAPVRRNFPVSQPTTGGTLAGTGGVVAWQGDSKVARYMVQMINHGGNWTNPTHQWGTSGTSVAISGVSPGTWDLRVGAFSEVAGRWEWQVVPSITIQ